MSAVTTLSSRHWLLLAIFGATVTVTIAVATIFCWFGSLAAVLAFVRGDEVTVIPASIDLGQLATGDVQETKLRVINLSSAPITVTGIHTSCSCVLADALPATIGAHESFGLHVTIHSPLAAGPFTRSAVIYTDSAASPQLPVTLVGHAVDPTADAAANESNDEENQSGDTSFRDDREPTAVLPSPQTATPRASRFTAD